MLFNGLIALGLMLLVSGVFAVQYRMRHRDWMRASIATNILLLVAGCIPAVISTWFTYQVTPELKIVGFPFPAAAWEFGGTYWADFVGPMTLPFTIANVVTWLLFPQFVFVTARLIRGPRAA